MEVRFRPRGVVEIDNARLIFRNFAGRGTQFNNEGNRNFSIVIPTEEIKDLLVNDTNEYGVGWNVKIKAPRNPEEGPFMHLPVKVSYKGRGPKVYLISGNKSIELNEDTIDMLDDIDIRSCNLDIRPYDDTIRGEAFRSAYLQSIEVIQEIDRFAARYADERYDEE